LNYQKFRADQLFNGYALLDSSSVLITDEKGVVESIVDIQVAGDDVQYQAGILSPGFVNCHCHLELSHMRGMIPKKTGLVDFVITVMQQRGFAEEKILEAIEQGEAEMLKNGIVAVGDICNTAHTILQKQKGNLHYYNFIEATGFVPQFAEKRFQQAEEVYGQFVHEKSKVKSEKWENYKLKTTNYKLSASIVPHAPYSTSLALMQLINEHSAGKIITIHNQETLEEERFFISGESEFRKLFKQFNIDISFYQPSGKDSLQTYLPWLNKASNLILVHNTFISEEDILFVKSEMSKVKSKTHSAFSPNDSSVPSIQLETGNRKLETFFCLCPNANLYIENSLPPVELLRKHACSIVVGTDSLASNHTLSILEELKTLHQHFPDIPLDEKLQWATLNGARALAMNDHLGSFEKGKQPGLVCINADLSAVRRII